jgi:hypothetical protein
VKFITGIIENQLSKYIPAANSLEANPVQRSVAVNNYYLQFATYAIMYGAFLAFFWWTRKTRNNNVYSQITFSFCAIVVFLAWFLDFVNDLAVLIPLIAK